MSLFGGLDDGVVESIPTLIDEDLEDLFAGETLVLLLPMANGTSSAGVPPGKLVSVLHVFVARPLLRKRKIQSVGTICVRPFATYGPSTANYN